MLEVEGGTPEWCMRILRHEAGHAIDNAYKLRQRRRRQQVFGPSYKAYPEFYDPKPYSKSFVLHLDSWYAQSHPDEDFAETFAVWLSQAGLARALRGLAGAEEARIHGRADEGRRRASGCWCARTAASIRCRRSGRRCAPTTNASAATTDCSTPTSTIAICASCSRTIRRTRRT